MSFFWRASLWIKLHWNVLKTEKNCTYKNMLLFRYFEQGKPCKEWVILLKHWVIAICRLYDFMNLWRQRYLNRIDPSVVLFVKIFRSSDGNGDTYFPFPKLMHCHYFWPGLVISSVLQWLSQPNLAQWQTNMHWFTFQVMIASPQLCHTISVYGFVSAIINPVI